MTEGDGRADEMGPFLLVGGARYVLWEVGEGGWVTRSVELVGDDHPRTAAALDEVVRERDSGGVEAVTDYEARYSVLMEKPIVDWNFPMRTSPRLSSSTSGMTHVEASGRGTRTSTGTNPVRQDWPWVSQGDVIDRPAYRAHGSAALSACTKATCVL